MRAKKLLASLGLMILGAIPFKGAAEGFQWEMTPKYVGEIHAGYKTTTKIGSMDTYTGMAELGTLQGVSLNKYLDLALGVDAFMMTHYYPNCDLRFGMQVFFDMRPAYPITDRFKVFLDLGLGGFFGVHSEPEIGNGFFCQFGPGFRYRKLNLSLGLQDYGAAKGTTAFYAKLGLYF